jgi:histidinol-phosphate/aromatic aminotransferase/cobyric acid decarboxylase-like protein
MLNFSKEINFLSPSTQIDYNKIDEVDDDKFVNSIAKRYKIAQNQIEFFNGLSSAIYSILKFLDLKYCFIYSPCSLEYRNAAINLEYEVRFINRFENIFLPIKGESIVIFANPSYLDGTYYDLEKLFEYWVSKDATIIIDETLIDFCGEDSAKKYFNCYKKIYIIKDFSKYYSHEKLGLSVIFSNDSNIKYLRKYEPDNKLSNFDMKYLEESLKDVDFKLISNSINIKNRIALEKILNSCKYVDTLFQSSSNSLLIKLKEISSNEFVSILATKDILIKDIEEFDFIDGSYINIYVNSQTNIHKLKEVLDVI